jgi:hypothetical protein
MSIWDKYPNYTEVELRELVAVTAQVLLETEEARTEFPPDLLHLPPGAASRQLLPVLQDTEPTVERDQIQHVLQDENLSATVSLQVLGEIRHYPELAARIADAYEERENRLAIAESVLLIGALVVLATRIRRIRWTEDEKEIDFYPAGDDVKQFLVNLISGGA